MRWRALVLSTLVLVLVAAGVAVRPEPAAACSCAAEPTPGVSFGRAEAVFAGQLTEIGPPLIRTSSGADQTLRFTVDRVYKGRVGRVVEVHTAQSSASCGLELQGLGPYVIFGSGTGTSFRADLCGGSFAGTAPTSLGVGRTPTATPAETPPPTDGTSTPTATPASPFGAGYPPTDEVAATTPSPLGWGLIVAAAAAAAGALVLVRRRGSRQR